MIEEIDFFESLKNRKLESWKVRKLESWKIEQVESWKYNKFNEADRIAAIINSKLKK